MRDLTVALIQTTQAWEDKTANFRHLEDHLRRIQPGNCDLVLLPEMFNTGFSMNTKKLAEEINGPSVNWLRTWADKLGCRIGGSLIISDDNNYFNRFVIVSSEGIEASYDKRHLFRMAGENDYFTAGRERVIYRFGDWNILLQVCYDLRFPVFSRNRTIDNRKEYDLAIYIANWPEKRNRVWSVLLQARAIENQAFCIGLNRVGEDGNGITYSGDSTLIDPWGNIEYQAKPSIEEVKLLTLNSQTLEEITRLFPAFRDADPL